MLNSIVDGGADGLLTVSPESANTVPVITLPVGLGGLHKCPVHRYERCPGFSVME